MRTLAAVALAVAVVAGGCGASAPDEPPVQFLEALFGHLYRGEHGAAWDSLYAPHQRVVTRTQYVACEGSAPAFPGQLEGVEVLKEQKEKWRVAGEEEARDSTAVTYRITVSLAGEPERITGTGHLVAVDGDWRWILNPDDFRAYRAGRCPVTSA